ncbi:MAG: transaldolase [Parcubacteria group bacterium Greene0714_7]|nr:MAG: transaldolase [Parcubacteria group bacterium Greene0714_7]
MTPKKIEELRIKLYADGSEEKEMLALAEKAYIKGFTTNPTLMHKAGVTDYTAFAKKILTAIPNKPISFEVFSDDFPEMERQARLIASWGENVYAKIPIMNTKGESSAPLVEKLSNDSIKLNVTMILTSEQVQIATEALSTSTPSIISVFAGRIADVGIDPIPVMRDSKAITSTKSSIELLWASTRELFNIYEAERIGAEIITVPPSILKKLGDIGKTPEVLTLEGVKVFYEDGKEAGFTL